jgi:hypothetical protein
MRAMTLRKTDNDTEATLAGQHHTGAAGTPTLAKRVARTLASPGLWLWVTQVLLAAVFLIAGGSKMVLPAEMLKGPVELPLLFLRFLGTAEVFGAFGLILPGLLRIRQDLTPLAAAGLVIIMTGATVLTLVGLGAAMASLPLVIGVLAAFVAYGRTRLAPQGRSAQRRSALRRSAQPLAA